MPRNHLADETSPYLQQHADNPVDWFPWGPSALEKARAEGKPILLSIGYAACHWCHVMAHESFEDPATAELMNRGFVNIKVDREERPDLDRIYQIAQQLLTGRSGGWPLTMFLSPEDQRPFFGGTYFPPTPRHGMPGFRDILKRVIEFYRQQPDELEEVTVRLAETLDELARPPAPGTASLDVAALDAVQVALADSFDARHGGFGRAPKFPHAAAIEFCLRRGAYGRHRGPGSSEPSALAIAQRTLHAMAAGGLFDHLGGGFCRYSVDDLWSIPHFEKMLYDNGQLLDVYALAAGITGQSAFAEVAAQTADWLLRDMRAAEGGFYSSLDADSEGHEGRFYLWRPEEARARLGEAEFHEWAPRYGLTGAPNFEGAWHLRLAPGSDFDAPSLLVRTANAKLLGARNLRVWPARDEKILTAWNALAIKGLARAARVLARADLAAAAGEAAGFLHRALWQRGRLLATYKDGRAHLPAYLDDHAFLADALLELLSTRWLARDLTWARALADGLLEHFEDRDAGGFFFTAHDHERLIHRSKSFADESLPAGNAVAASVLLRLGHLLAESRYLEAAQRTLQAGIGALHQAPAAHVSLANAIGEYLDPPRIVILRASEQAAAPWRSRLERDELPAHWLLVIPPEATELPPALALKAAGAGPLAYLCVGTTCLAPVASPEGLAALLASAADSRATSPASRTSS